MKLMCELKLFVCISLYFSVLKAKNPPPAISSGRRDVDFSPFLRCKSMFFLPFYQAFFVFFLDLLSFL